MRCDRCGRNIDDGPMVTMGAKRPYRNLCRTCWGVETRSSNTRLISALNDMTRRLEGQAAGSGEAMKAPGKARSPSGRPAAAKGRGRGRVAAPDEVEDRRHDPERPSWHL